MQQEKRKLKRRHLIYYLKVKDRDTEKSIGFLVDITTQGIMLMSEFPLDVGTTYHLKVLVQSEEDETKYLFFDAKSKWCERSVNTDFYDSGLELINVAPDDFIQIQKIIDELGFKD